MSGLRDILLKAEQFEIVNRLVKELQVKPVNDTGADWRRSVRELQAFVNVMFALDFIDFDLYTRWGAELGVAMAASARPKRYAAAGVRS